MTVRDTQVFPGGPGASSSPSSWQRSLRAMALTLAASGVVGCGSCGERAQEPYVQELWLTGAPQNPASWFEPPLPLSVTAMRTLERVTKPEALRGLLLRIDAGSIAMADAAVLADALNQARQEGLGVYCHLANGDEGSFFLAAQACDRVSMDPAGFLDIRGVALEMLYWADALDLLGLKADLIQVGDLKGAADPFTRSSADPAVIEALESVIDARFEAWIAPTARAREITPAALTEAVNTAPLTAAAALEAKLIDAVEPLPDMRRRALEASAASELKRPLSKKTQGLSLIKIWEKLKGDDVESETGKTDYVALLHLTGMIGADSGVTSPSERVIAELENLEKDESCLAAVMLVDSPGGAAFTSARLYRAVMHFRESKPIVAAVGSMAASGGYYVASAANRIVAAPGAIIGSIGVVGGKVDASGLIDRFDVGTASVARGKFARMHSPLRPYTSDERTLIRERMEAIHGSFIRDVAEGRGLGVPDVTTLADGRVFTSAQAVSRKLVDEIGSVYSALSLARELADLEPATPWRVRPKPASPLAQLLQGASGFPATLAEAGLHQAAPGVGATLRAVQDRAQLMDRQQVALTPLWLSPQLEAPSRWHLSP